MDITLENVESALTQFYHTNSALQAEAHQWLTAVQNSSNAWAFVWELLQPNRSCEAQFFAATTLHTKLMKNWTEVPEDQYDNLKQKILETIVLYSSGPKIVLNRLCIALATYLIRTSPNHWHHSLEDILCIFRPDNLPNIPPDRTVWILLEVLTVIPEEWSTMLVNTAHRNAVKLEMEKATPKVMALLENLMDMNGASGEVRNQAVKALTAWLPIGNQPLSENLNLVQKLVNIVRAQASDPLESCENELEALLQIVTTNQHQYQLRPVLQAVEMILTLHQLVPASENSDFVVGVYRVLIGAGESHCHLLLACFATGDTWQISVATGLLHSLLACTKSPGSYPTTEMQSHLTFPFWYMLQDDLMTLREAEMRAASPYVVPVYEELCRVLLYKSQQPPDGVSLTASEAELLRIYRQDIADTIVSCYFIVRHYLISLLTNTMARAETWQEVEAVLHVVFALAEMAWSCEDPEKESGEEGDRAIATGIQDDASNSGAAELERTAIISLLLNIPQFALSNKHVINALNHAIGAYSEWWIGHSDVLGQLIPTLVASFQDTETSTSATLALKDITLECTTSMAPFAPSLLMSCQAALAKGHLQQAECVRLMYSIGRLLSVLPYEEMLIQLGNIVTEHTNGIAQALSQPNSNSSKNMVLLRLRMLGTLCVSMYLNDKRKADPPTLLVIQKLLPVLNAIVRQWPTNPQIVQEVCKCLKGSVVNLVEACEPFVGPIVDLALTCYTTVPNTATIDLARQIFLLFGRSEKSGELVVGFLRTISNTTMGLATSSTQASESGEVLQAYFQLTGAIAKRNLPLIPLAVDPGQLFNLGVASLTLSESGTVKSAGTMLCTLISQSRDHPALVIIVQTHGEHLVHTLLRCIGSESPRCELDSFADIFLMLNKKYCDNLARWLNTILAHPNFPTEKATSAAKMKFTKDVLRERANRRKLQEVIQEFALICRGLVTQA
uniref:Importin-13 n=3 Tax=Lygus hesperus TaxID=30085 RepID=A0A0A9XGA6_LYGHE